MNQDEFSSLSLASESKPCTLSLRPRLNKPPFRVPGAEIMRLLLAGLTLLASVAAAAAHMVLIVPQADGKSAIVVFSDSLDPDDNVKIDKIAGLKLLARIGDKSVPVEAKVAEHKLTVELPANTRFVAGTVTYGISGKATPASLLVYHPKAVLLGTGADATIGKDAAVEIVPVTAGGKTRFLVLAAGKPVADSEGTITLPDGKKEKATTDKDGFTKSFEATGRYAAYFKFVEKKDGEHTGVKYAEIRHYATLVADVK